MSHLVEWNPEVLPPGTGDYGTFMLAPGETVAASRTTEVVRLAVGDVELFVKRHRYSLAGGIRGALRNTLFGPSRAAHEYRMLRAFSARGAAPVPAARGERRVLGLLRGAFVASVSEPDAVSLDRRVPTKAGSARRLGAFLGGLHAAGFVHGRLFARNVLAREDGDFRLVDLDRARAGGGRRAPVAERAKDLAFLSASLPDEPACRRLEVLAAYRRTTGESAAEARRLREVMRRYEEEARARLARRVGA